MTAAADERRVAAPPSNPEARPNWRLHVDPRDRSQRGRESYDADTPWPEQGRGPPGHNL